MDIENTKNFKYSFMIIPYRIKFLFFEFFERNKSPQAESLRRFVDFRYLFR